MEQAILIQTNSVAMFWKDPQEAIDCVAVMLGKNVGEITISKRPQDEIDNFLAGKHSPKKIIPKQLPKHTQSSSEKTTQGGTRAAVLKVIRSGKRTAKAISVALGKAENTIFYHLSNLVEDGVLAVDKKDFPYSYSIINDFDKNKIIACAAREGRKISAGECKPNENLQACMSCKNKSGA